MPARILQRSRRHGWPSMPDLFFERHVPHLADRMFDLVNDLETYPRFVPNVSAMEVRRDDSSAGDVRFAKMTVSFGPVNAAYTSRVEASRSRPHDHRQGDRWPVQLPQQQMVVRAGRCGDAHPLRHRCQDLQPGARRRRRARLRRQAEPDHRRLHGRGRPQVRGVGRGPCAQRTFWCLLAAPRCADLAHRAEPASSFHHDRCPACAPAGGSFG